MFCFLLGKTRFFKHKLVFFHCTAYQSLQSITTDLYQQRHVKEFCPFPHVPALLLCYFGGLWHISDWVEYLLSPFQIAATQSIYKCNSVYSLLNTRPVGFKGSTWNNHLLTYLVPIRKREPFGWTAKLSLFWFLFLNFWEEPGLSEENQGEIMGNSTLAQHVRAVWHRGVRQDGRQCKFS